jgi:hypothetical protein
MFMKFCRAGFVLYALILLLPGSMTSQASSTATPTGENLARIHWLGLSKISTDTNSARFMPVWQLPETAALVSQIFDKLSRWPDGSPTNPASALLRPLFEDLVTSEFYLEIDAPTNLQTSTFKPQFFLAVRLHDDRARAWQTNLAGTLEFRTGVHPVATDDGHGWLFQKAEAPGSITFSRDGEWTLVSVGRNLKDVAPEFLSKISSSKHRPDMQSKTNFWLEADFDLPCLADLTSLFGRGNGWGGLENFIAPNFQASTLNSIHLTVAGEQGNVATRGTINFSRPLDLALSPWEIPTNLIHQPLTSFTAVRGLGSWLGALPAWQKIQINPAPDEAYVWSQLGNPFLTHLAAPVPGASNQLSQMSSRLIQELNPWLLARNAGRIQWQDDPPSLSWSDVNIISPFLKQSFANQNDYITGCLVPLQQGDPSPPPPEILNAVLGTTNLIYLQTEQTGLRIEDGLYIFQLFRIIFHKPQLPPSAAATLWLKRLEPMLGFTGTTVAQTGPQQLAFSRKSTIGFTALELQLLADWFESPQFPYGLHTFLASRDPKLEW